MCLTVRFRKFIVTTSLTCVLGLPACYDCTWDPELYTCVANEGIEIGDNCKARSYPTLDIEKHCCPCPVPEACLDANGNFVDKPIPDDCAQYHEGSSSGSGASSVCNNGTCIPAPPEAEGWSGPVSMVSAWWTETEGADAVACPSGAKPVFAGSPSPPPPSCPTCTCDAPEGTCRLPTSWTVSSAICGDPGAGIKTNFDPPTGWDGTCNNDEAILQGKLCGGVPCVQSIAVSPPVIEESPCTPRVDGPRQEPPHAWDGNPATTPVQLCPDSSSLPTCASQPNKVCAPTAQSSARCFWRHGEHACPTGWGERFVLYEHSEGSRECSCTCGPPTGGTCKALVSVWEDAACSTFHFQAVVHAGDQVSCHHLKAGVALAGQTATILEYAEGTCAPSSGVEDKLTLEGPATVCCAVPIE